MSTYDHARRRRTKRTGREKGCWVYIAAEELQRSGFDPETPPPFYRVWATPRGGAFVRLYKEA